MWALMGWYSHGYTQTTISYLFAASLAPLNNPRASTALVTNRGNSWSWRSYFLGLVVEPDLLVFTAYISTPYRLFLLWAPIMRKHTPPFCHLPQLAPLARPVSRLIPRCRSGSHPWLPDERQSEKRVIIPMAWRHQPSFTHHSPYDQWLGWSYSYSLALTCALIGAKATALIMMWLYELGKGCSHVEHSNG